MKIFFYSFFFLFSTFSLYGCGDPEGTDDQRPQPPHVEPPSRTADETGNTPNPLIEEHNRQRAQAIEKYNKILKPNAPLPVNTKTTACTKEDKSINLEVNEYIEDITIKGNSNDLLCDFLIDGNVDKYATVEGDHCTKEATKKMDKLKAEEGYTCPDLQ